MRKATCTTVKHTKISRSRVSSRLLDSYDLHLYVLVVPLSIGLPISGLVILMVFHWSSVSYCAMGVVVGAGGWLKPLPAVEQWDVAKCYTTAPQMTMGTIRESHWESQTGLSVVCFQVIQRSIQQRLRLDDLLLCQIAEDTWCQPCRVPGVSHQAEISELGGGTRTAW